MISTRSIGDLAGSLIAGLVLILIIELLDRRLGGSACALPRPLTSLRRLVCRTSTQRLALVLIIPTAVLISIGMAAAIFDWGDVLRVNKERSFTGYFSTMLFYTVGLLALLNGFSDSRRLPWIALGCVFMLFGLSEGAELHERVEVRTGLPSLVIISPLALIGAVSLVRIRREILADRQVLKLLVGGLAAWFVSQASDPFHAGWKSIAEETLEMSGSILVALALSLLVKRRSQPVVRKDVDADASLV